MCSINTLDCLNFQYHVIDFLSLFFLLAECACQTPEWRVLSGEYRVVSGDWLVAGGEVRPACWAGWGLIPRGGRPIAERSATIGAERVAAQRRGEPECLLRCGDPPRPRPKDWRIQRCTDRL